MSNMGLELALKRSGIRMLRANVGDKYVLEEMRDGRDSGRRTVGTHPVSRWRCDHRRRTADRAAACWRSWCGRASRWPIGERSESVSADDSQCAGAEENSFAQIPAVQAAIAAAERELDGNGRVVVRYSGTEALARVMIEAESEEQMQALTAGIAAEIQKALGT